MAQHCLLEVLSVILDGPSNAAKTIVDVIEWVRHCILEIWSIIQSILDGLAVAAGTCRRCYWMGPEKPPTKLSMLLNVPSIVLPIILDVPTAAAEACCRCYWMGPALF